MLSHPFLDRPVGNLSVLWCFYLGATTNAMSISCRLFVHRQAFSSVLARAQEWSGTAGLRVTSFCGVLDCSPVSTPLRTGRRPWRPSTRRLSQRWHFCSWGPSALHVVLLCTTLCCGQELYVPHDSCTEHLSALTRWPSCSSHGLWYIFVFSPKKLFNLW